MPNSQGEPFTTYRHHSVIEQVFAGLENGPLGHLSSGKFQANTAWLTLAAVAHNLTRATATVAGRFHAKATGATVRATLINIPARITSGARRLGDVALQLTGTLRLSVVSLSRFRVACRDNGRDR